MSAMTELQAWIRTNLPGLDRELAWATHRYVRERLNGITGLDVQPNSRLDEGCAAFLARLKTMREAGEL